MDTTLLQIPYGALIFFVILVCVFINHRLVGNNRCWFMILFLLPNVAGAFGLHYVPDNQRAGRLICYYVSTRQHPKWLSVGLTVSSVDRIH